MKSTRKIAILKAMEKDCKSLTEKYYNIETSRACCGVSIMSEKEEIKILDCMSHYAEILNRIYSECNYNESTLNKWWLEEIVNSI